MTKTERLRIERNKQLPPWAHELSARAQHALLNAKGDGDLLSATPHDVRAYGERRWSYWPNIGKRGIAELGEAIGGWTHQEPIDGWE